MIAKLIRFSIQFRGFVLVVAGLLLLAGGLVANRTLSSLTSRPHRSRC
jgi:hypothetical protein